MIAFGIFCCIGAVIMGLDVVCMHAKGDINYWAFAAVLAIEVIGMLGCLLFAFVCFGGDVSRLVP